MSGPLDDETNEAGEDAELDPGEQSFDGSDTADEFGEDSPTWGAADPDFDRMLRDRIGPIEPMPTPAYAFERVLMGGRRRRARKLWAGATAAALVVMAGTAGTTVALNSGRPAGLGAADPGSSATVAQGTTPASVPFTTAAVASASPSASPSPSPATASPSPSASPTPQCASDTFLLTVTAAAASPGGTVDELIIVLTNTSGHACTAYGYPGLQLETESGQLQSTTVTRAKRGTAQHLTVQANASISTTAVFTPATPGATPGPGCALPSYSLAVIPPNQKQQVVQTITGGPITVCGNGVLNTGPMVPGPNG